MSSIKNLKKDINYVLGDVIEYAIDVAALKNEQKKGDEISMEKEGVKQVVEKQGVSQGSSSTSQEESQQPQFFIKDRLGDKAKANPRAHTAGSMNQKTAKQMQDRGLRFTAYNILNLEDPPYTTEIERAEWATRVLKLNFVKTIAFSYDKLKTF